MAFLYLVTACSTRSDTNMSPFPHGTITLVLPKQTVTFIFPSDHFPKFVHRTKDRRLVRANPCYSCKQTDPWSASPRVSRTQTQQHRTPKSQMSNFTKIRQRNEVFFSIRRGKATYSEPKCPDISISFK